MDRRTMIRDLLKAGLVALIPPRMAAEQDFVLRSEARLVLLDIGVTDRDGSIVSGLARESFQVFENDVRQEISVFTANELAVTLGLVTDQSRSMTPKEAEVMAAAETLIARSNPRDQLFVLHFNDIVRRALPGPALFSSDAVALRQALRRGVPEGRTALYDAMVEAFQLLDVGQRERKALVLISDGGDNASSHRRRDVIARIERTLATVYAIGLFSNGDPDRDPAMLKQLARISGGQAYFPASPADMDEVCGRIARDIRARYTVGYVPLPDNGPGPLRHVRVHLAVKGRRHLRARTRTVYRYDQTEI